MGGPSVAIGVEELHELGVHTLLRVGTCGALQPGIKMGDLVIAIGAVRSEGTPDGYVPKEYPAIASLDVVNALIESAEASRVPYHVGLMRSVDALYSDLVPDQMPRPDLRGELEMWTKAGIIGADMETSTLLIVSRLRKMRAGTVCLCRTVQRHLGNADQWPERRLMVARDVDADAVIHSRVRRWRASGRHVRQRRDGNRRDVMRLELRGHAHCQPL